ncbi:MAG: hypothetical protein EOP56_02045 [Sphingobacteriales bacterium]|nr:MAG: hypothetical protein EOP56_02045 [Sphingobacteriales bacterium]
MSLFLQIFRRDPTAPSLMRPYSFCLSFFFLLTLVFTNAATSQPTQYNISSKNGLPTDNVYNVLVDKYGYLWIATEKGVIKYNGYSLKVFDLSSGLVNDDVWHLTEDRKGRIWLSCISSEMGYIFKDHYHKTVIENPVLPIYPRFNPKNIVDLEHGIAFQTTSAASYGYICVEKNDTISSTLIDIDGNHCLLTKNGDLIIWYDNKVYKTSVTKKPWKLQYLGSHRILLDMGDGQSQGNYFFPHAHLGKRSADSSLFALNWNNFSYNQLPLDTGEFVTMNQYRNGRYYMTTVKNCLILDDSLNVLKKWSHAQLLDDTVVNTKPVTFIEDNLWNRCVTTSGNGIYINFLPRQLKAKEQFDLSGYKYVGSSKAGQNFWWNSNTHSLATISTGKQITKKTLIGIQDVKKIIPYDSSKSVILSDNTLSWYLKNGNTIRFENFFKPAENPRGENIIKSIFLWRDLRAVHDVIITSPSDLILFSFTPGLVHLHLSHDTITARVLSGERLPDLCYIKNENLLAAYDSKNIALYEVSAAGSAFRKRAMYDLSPLKKLEKIHADNHGNIFVQTQDKVFAYYPQQNKYVVLFADYNMGRAKTLVQDNKVIAATRGGLLFCSVSGPLNFGKTVFLPNNKDLLYSKCLGIKKQSETVVITTDKGVYEVPVPADQAKAPNSQPYRLLLHYKDMTRVMGFNDTIYIDQDNTELHFDAINPAGVGTLRFKYKIENVVSSEQDMSSNSLYLPKLNADKYYTFTITAYDDAWKSQPMKIRLYLVPFWWQTQTGKMLIWLLGISGVALVLLSVTYATRQVVLRQQTRKGMEMELKNLRLAFELKSVYSQINPHFIFNTLTTGLYFIKKKKIDEAYQHISSFSDLLRAYIKSSRNKYTSIAEEAENLEHYLKLQLARFEDKFTYTINIDPGIDPDTEKIPSLLLQPLVENAINHGIFHKEGKGKITIDFLRGEDSHSIVCLIDDDGIGRENSKKIKDESNIKETSYGTDLIKNLVDIFNTYEATKITMDYIDKELPLTGTIVKFTITKQ